MKTIEQARRELFEARFPAHEMRKFTDEDGDVVYADEWSQGAWIGFNAALDAVVIELPAHISPSQYDHDEYWKKATHHNEAVDDCRAAIESTNLGLKIR